MYFRLVVRELGPQFFAALILFSVFSASAHANVTEWMSVEEFLAEAFPEADQEAKVLWITPDIREKIEKSLNRNYPGLRIRYWGNGKRTAWILEQIGKERPITAGFVAEAGQLVEAHVLVYRESRGGEIRYSSFRDQFSGASLEVNELDRHIDGISGATLSVRSMKQMAETALILHDQFQASFSPIVEEKSK